MLILNILIITSVLTGCGGADSRKAKHFERGNEYYAEGNYDKARLEYKNTLQISPNDIAGYFALAQTLEKLGQVQQAGGFYLKVIELDPNHVQAKINISRFYLKARIVDKAREIIDEALVLDPKNPSAIALRGATEVLKGNHEAAVKDGNLALGFNAANLDALSLLAGLYTGSKEYDKAIAVLAKGVKLNPKNSELRMLLASIHANNGQNGQAIELLQEIITLNPDKFEYREQLARFYDANKATEEAIRVLRTAVKEIPDNEKAILSLANYMAKRMTKDDAEKELLNHIEKHPQLYELQFGLARLYVGNNQTEKAKTIYKNIIAKEKTSKHGLTARNQLAKISVLEKDFTEAEKLIAEVLIENPQDSIALTMRGSINLSRNELNSAIADFRTVLKSEPNQPLVSQLLAQAHVANNELDLAKEQYLKSIATAPRNISLRLELAQTLVNKGETDSAVEEISKATNIFPKNLVLLEALYKLNVARKDPEAALKVASRIINIDDTKAEGYYAAGLIYQNQGKLDAGYYEFTKALKRAKKSTKILTAIAKNLITQKRPKDAIEFLKKQIKNTPDNVSVQNLLGEVYLSQKQFKNALAKFKLAEKLKPEWPTPYRNLAATHLQQKNTKAAIDAFKRGINATDKNPTLSYSLASLYEQLGKTDEAISEFEEILTKSPDSPAANNNLAMMLVTYRHDQNSLNKAVKLVKKFVKMDDPNLLDTLGWVTYKNGDALAAIPYLEKAAKKLPNAAAVHYHLGEALFESGNKIAAKQALLKSLQAKENFPGKQEAEKLLQKIKLESS